jgi:phosphatidylserine decarboxylase
VKAKFSGWREGAKFYGPALVIGVGVSAGAVAAGQAWLSVLALAPGLFTLNFFRDPVRAISANPLDVVSPADGKVTAVEELESTKWYSGRCTRVSIFLSVFNVHVNRSPADATILKIEHKDGLYKNAMAPDSADVNESNTLWIDTPHGPMTVRQISGLIARRIICPAKVGESLTKGEKFGMIRFGSRTDLYLPRGAEVIVRPGDTVRGGASVVARGERKN